MPTATTRPPQTWYRADFPTFEPPPLPGSGGAFGSGCSPGSGSLPDGVWFGYVRSHAGGVIEFDLACLRSGEAGPTISNNSTRLRSVRVAGNAVVHRVYGAADFVSFPFAWWPDLLEEPLNTCSESCPMVWLYVNGGEITELTEVWLFEELDGVAAIELTITGELFPEPDGVATPGDAVIWLFEITNTGTLDLDFVEFWGMSSAGCAVPMAPFSLCVECSAGCPSGPIPITEEDIAASGVENCEGVDAQAAGGTWVIDEACAVIDLH